MGPAGVQSTGAGGEPKFDPWFPAPSEASTEKMEKRWSSGRQADGGGNLGRLSEISHRLALKLTR